MTGPAESRGRPRTGSGCAPAVRTVAVLGGGIAGSVVAVALAQRGVAVELVEITPVWGGVGHGISLQGNALRALERIGVVDEVLAAGYPFDNLRMLRADGTLIVEVPTARTGGEHLPATLGIMRAALQRILAAAVYAAGVSVRLGRHAVALEQSPEQNPLVSFDDGTRRRYDLVVGADGIRSGTRAMLGIAATPRPSGMSIWRVAAPRPADLRGAEVYYGGPRYKAGYAPTGADTCYAYLLDEMLDRSTLAGRDLGAMLRQRGSGYGGIWGRLRDGIPDGTPVNYQWIEWLLVEPAWHRGRVVLIGDAVHACPPLIAQGAAMCAEDAVVLAEMLGEPGDDVGKTLDGFVERRLPRVRRVVEASMQLVEWEINPGTPGADPAGVMGRALRSLVEPP